MPGRLVQACWAEAILGRVAGQVSGDGQPRRHGRAPAFGGEAAVKRRAAAGAGEAAWPRRFARQTHGLLRLAAADIAGDLPGAAGLRIAELVVAERRDRVDRDIARLARRRDDAQIARRLVRGLRSDPHAGERKL